MYQLNNDQPRLWFQNFLCCRHCEHHFAKSRYVNRKTMYFLFPKLERKWNNTIIELQWFTMTCNLWRKSGVTTHRKLGNNIFPFNILFVFIAKHLSRRLIIIQCSQFAFVCMYVCMYVCNYVWYMYACVSITLYWCEQKGFNKGCVLVECSRKVWRD